MPSELVREEWNRYLATMYPVPLPLDQAGQLRKAFYAGASAMFGLLARAGGPREALEIRRELTEFAKF